MTVCATTHLSAFSLLGPYDTYQTATLGYNLPGDSGGPMNLGEEYRINTPIVYVGVDDVYFTTTIPVLPSPPRPLSTPAPPPPPEPAASRAEEAAPPPPPGP